MAEGKHTEGWVTFAIIMASVAGVVNAIFGISTLFMKEAFPDQGLVFLEMQQWGWLILIFGILQIVTAFALIMRKNWGRIFAIVMAALSLIGWVVWVGAFPFAGISALVIDILIIYGLSVTREYFT